MDLRREQRVHVRNAEQRLRYEEQERRKRDRAWFRSVCREWCHGRSQRVVQG